MLKNAGIALLPLIEGVRSMGLRYLADTRRLADGIRAAPSGLFLRELLESPAVVGAVWPSSARLARAMAGAGALFLIVYGWRALQRARATGSGAELRASDGGAGLNRAGVLAQAAAFTLLNPHVYLDTVLLMGSIGAQQPAALRGWFIAGASLASALWFGALGFGARWLAPWFARPRAWQLLDGLIGLTMLGMAALLLRMALQGA